MNEHKTPRIFWAVAVISHSLVIWLGYGIARLMITGKGIMALVWAPIAPYLLVLHNVSNRTSYRWAQMTIVLAFIAVALLYFYYRIHKQYYAAHPEASRSLRYALIVSFPALWVVLFWASTILIRLAR